VSHNKLITNIAAFDNYFSSLLLHELEDDDPNVFAQTRVGELEVERFRGSDGHVGVHGLEAEEERGADGNAGGVGGRGEAAEGERGAVDKGGEGVGGIGEEGGERSGAVVVGGDLQGSVAVDIVMHSASGCSWIKSSRTAGSLWPQAAI